MLRAEHQSTRGNVELRRPWRADIRFGRFGIVASLLSFDHALHDGCIASLVPVHANPEVYFLRPRILAERGHEAQDRIGTELFQ